ncbi:MAG: endonuclease/exonuclease/phosphatase family protein [Kiloniellaceae bacterium]
MTAGSTMKLVSYNIQFSRGKDLRYDLGRIAEEVEGADVIALQEVERNWKRSGMVDQPAELADLLPDYFWVYGPPFDLDASEKAADGLLVNRRKQFGNMLLSRMPILSSRLHLLPKFTTQDKHNMQRGALEAVLETGERPLRVYSIHLADADSAERLAQIATLLDKHRNAPEEGGAWTGMEDGHRELWECEAGPPPMPEEAILMGDFNLEPGSREYQALVGPWAHDGRRWNGYNMLVDAWVATGHEAASGITSPADPYRNGDRPKRIDYCFLTDGLANRLRKAWIDGNAQGSDHQPMWIELDM